MNTSWRTPFSLLQLVALLLALAVFASACGSEADELSTSSEAATDRLSSSDLATTDAGDDDATEDSAVEDSAMADSALEDSAMADSALEDSAMADSALEDSAMADSALEDSAMADSAMADSALEDSAMADSALEDSAMADSAMEGEADIFDAEPAPTDDSSRGLSGSALYVDAGSSGDTAGGGLVVEAGDAVSRAEASASASDDSEWPVVEIWPEAGLLTAAAIDDNLNFDWFNRLLGDWFDEQGQRMPTIDLSDRIVANVTAPNGVGVGNIALTVSDGRNERTVVTTSAGTAFIYPDWLGLDSGQDLTVTHGDVVTVIEDTSAVVEISIDEDTAPPSKIDVALVLDVTGSMTDELRYLTVEFEAIIARLAADYGTVDMRFALVVYRDIDDDFVTQTFNFTGDVSEASNWLADQQAVGGGDFPEAMDRALIDAEELSWRTGPDVARVLVLNADAPPHDSEIARTLTSARTLGQQGVRIYPLAASGVDRSAEFLMRTMAATTGGRHMFLTSDSGIGGAKLEPKAQCYVVTNLSDLLYHVIATELAGERIEANDAQIIRTVGNYDRGTCLQ